MVTAQGGRCAGSTTMASFIASPWLRSRRRSSRQSRSSHSAEAQPLSGRNEAKGRGGGGGEEDRRHAAQDDKEEAEEARGRRLVVSTEVAEEAGIAGRTEEGSACERGTHQRGLRREAEEDLVKEVVPSTLMPPVAGPPRADRLRCRLPPALVRRHTPPALVCCPPARLLIAGPRAPTACAVGPRLPLLTNGSRRSTCARVTAPNE